MMVEPIKKRHFFSVNITKPEFFSGRKDEIGVVSDAVQSCLSGNPQHLLVLGDRGIGKSSLVRYVEKQIKTGEERWGSGTVYPCVASLGTCNDTDDVCIAILEGFKNLPKTAWNRVLKKLGEIQGISVGQFGVITLMPRDKKDVKWITPVFPDLLVNTLNVVSQDMKAVLVILDETERISRSDGIASTLKSTIETVTYSASIPTIWMMTVNESSLSLLTEDHQSFPGLWKPLSLNEFSVLDIQELFGKVLPRCKPIASISDKAIQLLYTISEGLPAVVQEIAEAAYVVDSDNMISEEDVMDSLRIIPGVHKGAIQSIYERYFRPKFYRLASLDEYFVVLETLAVGEEWISLSNLSQRLPDLSKAQLVKSLDDLTRIDVLQKVDIGGKECWQIQTRLMKVWLRMRLLSKVIISNSDYIHQ